MIAIIKKAILHILDFNSGATVYSEQELDIQSSSVQAFLTKHIEKLYHDPNAQSGIFYPTSQFRNRLASYVGGSLDFVGFSRYVAELMYSSLAQSDAADPADLVVCDLTVDNNRLVAVLKCNNKVGFTHQVIAAEGAIKNDIIHHYAILPGPAQKIDEYAFVDTTSLDIKFSDKKRSVDGESVYVIAERVLECSSSISPKRAVDLVNSITRKVAEGDVQGSVAAVAKAKNYLVENAAVSEYLDPIALGKEVFCSSPMLQEEYMKEVKNACIPEAVKVDMDLAVKKGKNHRIKTDTGIEIAFPADYFKNTDYIEIINNPDGTLSIALKNIGKIINS